MEQSVLSCGDVDRAAAAGAAGAAGAAQPGSSESVGPGAPSRLLELAAAPVVPLILPRARPDPA
eukprot:COSAG04_NODE_11719_length_692_cov_1.676223_1_plen_63_part_10